jgi:hypothetical protein
MEKAVILAIIVILLVGVQVSNGVKANPVPTSLPNIVISADGSIQGSLSPLPITKNGNLYALTGNISGYGLDIQCSNIIFNGEGYTFRALAEYNSNSGISIDSNGVTVENTSINQYYVGIDVKGSSNTVTGSTISAYDNGINIEGQSNIITENYISDCGGSGVGLSGSNNNVEANTINCGACISLNGDSNKINRNLLIGGIDMEVSGSSNSVTGNTITGENIFDASKFFDGLSSYGILFSDPASLNIINGNAIKNNFVGIGLDKQSNTFYLNNFINNTYNVRLHIFSDPYAPYSMNVFDNGSIGNFWSGWSYNMPYVINGNITDNYPLTTPYTIGTTGAPTPTQTPTTTPTLSQTPTPATAVPEFPILVILPLSVAISLVAVILLQRKHPSKSL